MCVELKLNSTKKFTQNSVKSNFIAHTNSKSLQKPETAANVLCIFRACEVMDAKHAHLFQRLGKAGCAFPPQVY